jgi:hypothetical protein
MMERVDLDVKRILLAEPLTCGMTGCATPTTSALLEPDAQTAGLWRLLPVCSGCSSTFSGARRATYLTTRHAPSSGVKRGRGRSVERRP